MSAEKNYPASHVYTQDCAIFYSGNLADALEYAAEYIRENEFDIFKGGFPESIQVRAPNDRNEVFAVILPINCREYKSP